MPVTTATWRWNLPSRMSCSMEMSSRPRVAATSWPASHCSSSALASAESVALFALKERCDQTQIGAGAEQQRSKDRRSHNHVRHGKTPASGFAMHSANVKAKAYGGIDERDGGRHAQQPARGTPTEETCNSGKRQHTLRMTGVYMTRRL